MAGGTGWSRGAWSLRTHFLLFSLSLVLPLAGLAGFLFYQVAARDREQVEQRMVQIATGVAADLDRELQRRITILETLATSLALAGSDLATFHAQASAALRRDRAGVFLADRSLQQVLNTYVPYGTALPSYGTPETATRTFQSKVPQISDFFVGRVTKRPAFDINIPIFKDDEVEYVLAMGLEPFMLEEMLLALKLPPEWIIGIIDSKGIILARSGGQERLVGTPLPPNLSAQPAGTASMTVNLEGNDVLRATAGSELSGWQVAVNFPMAAAQATLHSNLTLLGVWSLLTLLLAAAGATWFARVLARPIHAAAQAAADLALARPVVPIRSHLIEANELVAALHSTSMELDRSRGYQRMLLGELNHRVKNLLSIIIAMTLRTLSSDQMRDARNLLAERFHSLARAHDLLVKSGWEGAPFTQLVEAELTPFVGRVEARGPQIVLKPSAAQTITMILHELLTNAMKYGALSVMTGQIRLVWRVYGDAEECFGLRWEERGGPLVVPPVHKGFGTTLLEASLPQSTVRLSYNPEGLVYELDIPRAAISDDSAIAREGEYDAIMRFDTDPIALRRAS